MVIVEPLLFHGRKELVVDHLSTHGDHGNVLESEIWLVPEPVVGLDFLRHKNV